jgi:hypothetical protein
MINNHIKLSKYKDLMEDSKSYEKTSDNDQHKLMKKEMNSNKKDINNLSNRDINLGYNNTIYEQEMNSFVISMNKISKKLILL